MIGVIKSLTKSAYTLLYELKIKRIKKKVRKGSQKLSIVFVYTKIEYLNQVFCCCIFEIRIIEFEKLWKFKRPDLIMNIKAILSEA